VLRLALPDGEAWARKLIESRPARSFFTEARR
jgi:hypothetical protein